MTTTSATWFYRDPERIAYYLEERVNQTFWQARLNGLWLDCVSAEPPYRMSGVWREVPVEIEWVPGEFFILRVPSDSDSSDFVNAVSHVLALSPAFNYTDPDERLVTEWHVDGGKARWQDIQGKAAFANLQRLSR
jgi:hypothetical protein